MNWSEVFSKRYEIHKKWPEIWDVPIGRKRFSLVCSHLSEETKLLDIGADKKSWKPRLEERFPRLVYRSMDINQTQEHNWYVLSDINDSFDAALFFEVIEHMTLSEGVSTLQKIHEILNPRGTLIVTTPNIFYPSQYLRDVTHVQPWSYDELGGVLLACGFEVVEMWRLWNSTFLDRLIRLSVGHWFHRYIGVDFSRTLMVIARKP